MATEIDIAVTTTTYNVTIVAEPNEYVVNITTNASGGGVESVTGTTVDNTDPLNPVVGVPNLMQVLAVGDREYKAIGDLNYTFIPADAQKWISFENSLGQEATIVSTGCLVNCASPFVVACGSLTITAGSGVTLYDLQSADLNVNVNDVVYPRGYIGQLKKISNTDWAVVAVSDAKSAIQRGAFSGEFALSNAVRGGEYTPLTQTGALTLSIGASAVNGGIDTVLLTANGSAIDGFSTWKKLSSDSISTTASTVMFIMVRQYQGVIYYTVNIIT